MRAGEAPIACVIEPAREGGAEHLLFRLTRSGVC